MRYVAYPVCPFFSPSRELSVRLESANAFVFGAISMQDPDALTEGNQDDVAPSKEDATARSMAAFESVFENGTNIELDHHLVYFSRAFPLYFSLRSVVCAV